MLRRGLMKFVDREPVAAVSLGLGLFGFSLPFIVPPIRKSMGLCTKQVLYGTGCVRVVVVVPLCSEPPSAYRRRRYLVVQDNTPPGPVFKALLLPPRQEEGQSVPNKQSSEISDLVES